MSPRSGLVFVAPRERGRKLLFLTYDRSENRDIPTANPKFEKVRRCGTATNELG